MGLLRHDTPGLRFGSPRLSHPFWDILMSTLSGAMMSTRLYVHIALAEGREKERGSTGSTGPSFPRCQLLDIYLLSVIFH